MRKSKRNHLEIVPNGPGAGDDRRTFCRFFVKDVPVRFKDLKFGAKGEGVCRDFGGGGAGMDSPVGMRLKTPLEMWFDFADGFEPMHLLGRVVWARGEGASWKLGVSFDRQRLMSMSRILKDIQG
ncbi:MAG: PilZ domain-containing protein [Candidatus Omnitrophota bacterium]